MGGLRSYEGGVAIVTGAASGIGKAVAEELARRGCEVVLADIDAELLEATTAGIRAANGKVSARRLDVTDAVAGEALVNETHARSGRLDYLFNNAGIAVAGEAAHQTLEDWRRIVEVNLMGVVHGVLAAYPLMIRQGFGHLVNTASSAGLLTVPGITSYAATKHAVVGLSKALRAEAHGYGVRVSAVCPGVIRTPMLTGGKRGVFLFRLPEKESRAYMAALGERLRPMDTAAFARRLLDRVARNHSIIVIPRSWHFAWWLDRLFPALGSYLARRIFAAQQRRLEALRAPAPN